MKHEKVAEKSGSDAMAVMFSDAELDVFQFLRGRYSEDHDFFSEAERVRLRFIRWLLQNRRFEP